MVVWRWNIPKNWNLHNKPSPLETWASGQDYTWSAMDSAQIPTRNLKLFQYRSISARRNPRRGWRMLKLLHTERSDWRSDVPSLLFLKTTKTKTVLWPFQKSFFFAHTWVGLKSSHQNSGKLSLANCKLSLIFTKTLVALLQKLFERQSQ